MASASLAALEAKHGKLPDTLMAESPSGSVHRIYKHPGNGVEVISHGLPGYPGVDIKGDGGMFVAPPSCAAAAVAYRWLNDSADRGRAALAGRPGGQRRASGQAQEQPIGARAASPGIRGSRIAFEHIAGRTVGRWASSFRNLTLRYRSNRSWPSAAGCGEAFETGGADQSEALWRDSLRRQHVPDRRQEADS